MIEGGSNKGRLTEGLPHLQKAASLRETQTQGRTDGRNQTITQLQTDYPRMNLLGLGSEEVGDLVPLCSDGRTLGSLLGPGFRPG